MSQVTLTIKSVFLLMTAAFVSIGLMALSWPRFQASFTYLPVDTALNKFYAGSEIPARQILPLITRAEEAVTYHDHYRYREGISLLNYLYGIELSTPTLQTRPALEKSLVEAENALAVAPARPMIWQRAAIIHATLNHPPENVINALNMSIYTGRVEPTLFIERLALGSRYQQWMDTEAEGLLVDQALLTWKLQARQFARAVNENRINWLALRSLLESRQVSALEQMEVAFESVQ